MSIREYKSDVFSMLMEYPEYALDTYNALTQKHYGLADIEIHKLNEGVLLSVRNDASFLVDSYLNLWEHQSTFNPNMPLRFLLYYSDLIANYIKDNKWDLYGKKRITIPTPKFVVFYNGLEQRADKEIFRLSDSYEHKCNDYKLDLTCEVFNINPGCNEDLLTSSKVLSGYTTFVEKVRLYDKEMDQLKDAVNKALEECIAENILADFFTTRKQEVLHVAVLDFTFEQREKLIARDNFEEGVSHGIDQGIQQGITKVAENMLRAQKPLEEIADMTGLSMKSLKEIAQRIDAKGK